MKHKNFHTNTCVFTAPDAHMHTVHTPLLYIHERERERGGEREREVVRARQFLFLSKRC